MTEAVVADSDGPKITPNSLQREAASSRVPYLIIVILLLAIALTYLAQSDPAFLRPAQTAMTRINDYRDRVTGQIRDFRVGADVRSALSPALQEVLAKSAPYEKAVIVFFGPCTACGESELLDWETEGKKAGLPVVIISRDKPDNIAASLQRTKISIPIIADTDGATAGKFGAFFVPRAYAVSEAGELIYIQQDRRQDTTAAMRQIAASPGGKQ